MLQNIQDDVQNEVVKIQLALAFRCFVHQFPNYSLSNIEGASLYAIKVCKNRIKYQLPDALLITGYSLIHTPLQLVNESELRHGISTIR